MGLGQTHKWELRWCQLAQPKKKGGYCKMNENDAMDLEKTTLNASFTQPATFGKRHYSPTL
jgi:hypothetical protein